MSVPYYGDYPEDHTHVIIPINTFSSNDPSASVTVTNLLNTDVHIHKDGAVAQRNNAAGITMTVDFDGITGNHVLIIDTSDNTVADFYVTGKEYQVRVEGATVDAGAVNAFVGTFSIERGGGVLALLKNATYGIDKLVRSTTPANTLDVSATGEAGLDFDNIKDATGAHTLTNITVPTVTTNTDMRGTDGANTTVPDAAGVAATPAEVATALTNINLDHLMKTAVANNADMTAEVVDGTVLSNLMSKTSDTSTYAVADDSFEAVGDRVKDVETDTGTTLDTLIKDIPTTAELALRTLLTADYVVVGDTIAGVTAVTNDVGITQAGADRVWGTAARVLTAGTNLNDISTAQVNTEVDNALNTAIPGAPTADSINQYIQHLKWVLANKMAITEATGNTVGYKDDGITQAYSVAAAFTTAAGITTRKQLE